MEQPKKNKKGLIITLSVVGGLLVVGGIVAALYFMGGASRQDTLKQLTAVEGALDAQFAAVASTQKVDQDETAFAQSVIGAQNAIEKTKSENEKLGKMKPVTTGEGKRLYDAYATKVVATNTFQMEVVQGMSALQKPITNCKKDPAYNASKDAYFEEYYSRLAGCYGQLKIATGKIKNPELLAYAKSLEEAYNVLGSELAGVQLFMWNTPQGERALKNARAKAEDIITTAEIEFRKAIAVREEATSSVEAHDALEVYLKS